MPSMICMGGIFIVGNGLNGLEQGVMKTVLWTVVSPRPAGRVQSKRNWIAHFSKSVVLPASFEDRLELNKIRHLQNYFCVILLKKGRVDIQKVIE